LGRSLGGENSNSEYAPFLTLIFATEPLGILQDLRRP
jgi:hypothetical protein